MLEGTPKRPFRGLTTHLARVERNMRLRRKRLLATLQDDEIAPTVSTPFITKKLVGVRGGRAVMHSFNYKRSDWVSKAFSFFLLSLHPYSPLSLYFVYSRSVAAGAAFFQRANPLVYERSHNVLTNSGRASIR